MKDYKLKQRNLRASHTLGWSSKRKLKGKRKNKTSAASSALVKASSAAPIELAERLFVGWLWFQKTCLLRN
jgi:hypothetical protein